MRLAWIAPLSFSLALAGCGASDPSAPPVVTGSLEGDAALVASAQTISDAVGGCVHAAPSKMESKVIGLENGAIVMLACSESEYSYTHRLFSIRAGKPPELLSIPDYDGTWYAADQASMAELDAGAGVLTTLRKGGGKDTCGSEGRYQWNGERFTVQEMHWQDCATTQLTGPPFPVVWPTQVGSDVDPNGATPAP